MKTVEQIEAEALVELNQIYAEMKWAAAGLDLKNLGFFAPELRPQISSTQVKALVAFLARRGLL